MSVITNDVQVPLSKFGRTIHNEGAIPHGTESYLNIL
jgi:hypothetical protein